MKITFQSVLKFVQRHGDVEIRDTQGKTHRLRDGAPDTFDLVEKADCFKFNGTWRTRAQFEKILDEHST